MLTNNGKMSKQEERKQRKRRKREEERKKEPGNPLVYRWKCVCECGGGGGGGEGVYVKASVVNRVHLRKGLLDVSLTVSMAKNFSWSWG